MAESYGIKVSPKNVDAQTATAQQLKLLSTKDSLKVYKWGTTPQTALSGDYASVEVSHGLGYAPCILVFANNSGTYYPMGGVDDISGLLAFSDSSKLYIEAYNSAGKLTVLPPCKYYILIDKAQNYSGISNVDITGDIGLKVSLAGKDAFEAQEYDLSLSSKFKSLQYFSESIKSETLTLPAMFASFADQTQVEYQYVDFNHGLGYPPLFMAWFKTSTIQREIPYAEYNSVLASDYLSNVPYANYEVFAYCDSTKIRVYFRRTSKFDYYQFLDDGTISYDNFAEQTITITVIPFAENLAGLNYGE